MVKFTDVTASMPGLEKVGLVTGAIWSDADGDGWADLLIPTEWGPVKLFHNAQGQLVDATTSAGLADLKGWWRGIAAADIDHDGDLDYVVTNLGLNTKYKQPTPGHPQLTYYADFDGTGQSKIVEVKREGEELLPERGRSCSSTAMPFIKEKFPTFHLFAKASLQEVYSPEKLAQGRALRGDGISERHLCKRQQRALYLPAAGDDGADRAGLRRGAVRPRR